MAEPTRNNHRAYTYLIILAMITLINTLLSRFAEITVSNNPGVTTFYFAVAFMIVFTLWFGAWGAIAAYAGCIIGAGLSTMPFSVNVYWSLADLWQVLIPLVAFKAFNADAGLKTKRDFLIFLIFGLLLNNLAGAIWGSIMLSVGGVSAWNSVPNTLIVWFAGNLVVTLVIATLLLKYITPYIIQRGLFIKGYWV
jgi:hypothetical protein